MTTREMILQAWELAGEPEDLDPIGTNAPYSDTDYIDTSSLGVTHYLRAITNAQNMLANWKTRRGRPIRFKKFYKQRNVKLGRTDSIECSLSTDGTVINIPSPPSWVDTSSMDSCRIDVTWEGYVDTVASDASYSVACMFAEEGTAGDIDIYLMDAIELEDGAVTTSLTCQIFFDRYRIVSGTGIGDYVSITLPETFRNIMRISTASDGSLVERAGYREDLINSTLTDGTPSEWYAVGERVFFDTYIIDPEWITIEYQAMPTTISDVDQDIDIPLEWHSVLLMLVVWQEAKRMQDVEKEAMLKSQINSTIELMRTEAEEEFLRESTQNFRVVREDR